MGGWSAQLGELFSRTWSSVRENVLEPTVEPDQITLKARETAPVLWLLGKVQSGKTSIVRALTRCTDAEIGHGYKACTRTARVFDFPAEAPAIRFLDTRGLGETAYDPAEDIAVSERRAHLLLVVMRALDPQQETIIDVVRQARLRHPDWPVVVAQTSLHDGYPTGGRHALPYRFAADPTALAADPAVPADLARSLARQRALFAGVAGTAAIVFVPIDFTREDDGFDPVNYGMGALLAALQSAAPAGLAASLLDMHARGNDARAQRAHPHVMGYAAAAAAADLVPAAGAVAVPAVQAKMLHSLARIYGVAWDKHTLGEFAGCLGAGTLVRTFAGFGIRQFVKLVPLYGQTVGATAAAAASFAATFALGKAACVFLARRRTADADPAAVSQAYAEALAKAFRLVKQRERAGHGANA